MAKKRVTYALLVLAIILLAGSAIGSTRAAITYYSDNDTAEITVSRSVSASWKTGKWSAAGIMTTTNGK